MTVTALLLFGWLVAAWSCGLALAGWRTQSGDMTVIAIVGFVAGVAIVFTGLGLAAQ